MTYFTDSSLPNKESYAVFIFLRGGAESVRSRFLGVITKEYETTKSRKKQKVCVMVLWDYHKGDPGDKEPQRGSNDI